LKVKIGGKLLELIGMYTILQKFLFIWRSAGISLCVASYVHVYD